MFDQQRPTFTVRHEGESIHVVDVDFPDPKVNEWRVLLRSDAHHDNKKCDRDLEAKHLDMCMANGWAWLDVGDLFCAMGGKWDKRSNMKDIDQRYTCGNYTELLLRYATDFYGPRAANCIAINEGNHEREFEKRHELSLTRELCDRIKAKYGVTVGAGSYHGWVKFQWSSRGAKSSTTLRYFHGSGGGGMMTHGVLTTRRDGSILEDCDVSVSGHTHDHWAIPLPRVSLKCEKGVYREVMRPLWHVKCGTYKNEWGPRGWHVETGKPPKPIGAMWMIVRMDKDETSHYRVPTLSFMIAN